MKRLITPLLLLVLALPVMASSAYTYTSVNVGYGYSYYLSTSHHAADIGFSAGYIPASDSSFSVGAGSRVNMLLEGTEGYPLSITTLIGADMVYTFSDILSLRVIAGPSFNIMDRGDGKSSIFSIAPATDISLDISLPAFDIFSISVGTAIYSQIGIGHLMFGVTVNPYVSMVLKFPSFSTKEPYIY